MLIWIAGWPHNGSTLLRQIIRDCFDVPTWSKYDEPTLDCLFPESRAWTKDWSIDKYNRLRNDDGIHLVKTHEAPADNLPAIFVVRDGRDAMVSLSHFWKIPVRAAITSEYNQFMPWSYYWHVWEPYKRPDTAVVRFEDMVNEPDQVAQYISKIIGFEKPLRPYVDDFEEMKKIKPEFFRDRIGVWRDEMSDRDLELFWQLHGDVMRRLSYV